jgi:Mn2+/Fe2+ NRAMP family transporter
MTTPQSKIESDRQMLREAMARGTGPKLWAYLKLSGPGWIASAITLGGGSLASSLYLGVLAGFSLLWLQPLAMIFGVIMLSAIGYVTLSTGERPFRAINEHVNPVLGWAWALAVAAANVVWCMPQFALANGVLSNNLLPEALGERTGVIDRWAESTYGTEHWLASNASTVLVVVVALLVSTLITWVYDRGGLGIRIYEWLLKGMVGLIVVCFFGVVVMLSLRENLDWRGIWGGLVPDFGQFFRPAASFNEMLDAIGPVTDPVRQYWSSMLVTKQRDVMISAAATAVGINMTFMFPYTLLKRGWTKEFRGLSIFDLSTGMFIPYVLATGCVVIASAAQFHTKLTDDFVVDGSDIVPPKRFVAEFDGMLQARRDDPKLHAELAAANAQPDISLAEKKLAAVLVDRKATDLSLSLKPFTGAVVANYIFGLGVLAMTLSTITILMLISGFVFCEMLGLEPRGWAFRLATLPAGIVGALGPFLWAGKASFYLAVPTSVFGFTLLPFAYITFVLLLNSRTLLGDEVPRGVRRLMWNTTTGIAATVASIAAVYMIWDKARWIGIAAVVAFVLLAAMVHINRINERRRAEENVI